VSLENIENESANQPLISVIVPTYNRARLLKKTLLSILNQTYKSFEIIVVDDGSDDNNLEVCNGLEDNRIRYIRIENSKDIAKVRNTGLKNSLGKYIAFCDDDDIWLSEKLEKQIVFLKDFNFVCSGSKTIDFKDDIIEELIQVNSNAYSCFGIFDLFMGNFIVTSSVLVLKSELGNGFNETGSTNSAEDYELWLKVAEKNNMIKIEEALVLFRKHSNSSSFDRGLIYSRLLASVLKILSAYARSLNPEINFDARIGILKNTRELIRVYLFLRKYFLVIVCYFKGISTIADLSFLRMLIKKKLQFK